MEKTINIDFDNSSSVLLSYDADILGAQYTKYASWNHTHGSVLGYNVSATSASNGLTLSVSPGAGMNSIYAGSNVTLTTNGASTTVAVYGLQSSGNYLTTAALSNHSHGIAAATGMIGGTIGSGTNWSISIPDFLLTAAESNHTHSNYLPMVSSSNFATSYLAGTFLTTAARSTHIHGAVSGTNISATSASNGLALSVRDAMGTNTSVMGTNVYMTGNTSGLTISVPHQQLVFSDSNGVSFGASISGSSSTITASVLAGVHNVNLDGNTVGTMTTMSSGTITIAGGNNITLSQDGNAVTIIGPTLTASATAANAVHAGDYIVLSVNGADTTVSVTNLQATSATSLITSNAMHTSERGRYFYTSNNTFANSTHNHGGITLALTNLTGTTASASNGLTISLSANTGGGGGGGVAIRDAAATITNGTAYFSNANGISFGVNGSTITGSHNAYSATSQLSATFAHTSHTHSNLYAPLAGTTYYLTSNLSHTFAQTSQTHPQIVLKGSGTYTQNSGTVAFSNNNGVSFGLTAGTMTASISQGNVYFVNPNGTSGSNMTFGSSANSNSTSIFITAGGGAAVAIRGSATSVLSTGTVIFTNSNGIAFGLTSNTMTASYTVPSGSVYYTNGSNVTWGSSVNGISTSIMLTAGGGTGGGGGGPTLKGSGTYTQSTGTIAFSNSNGISFGLNAGTMTASHNAITTAMNSTELHIRAIGNTASSNAFTSGSVMLSGENLTVNTSANGASQYLRISAPAMGYLYFSNTNGHSWSSSVAGVSTSIYIVT
jgi:hypothetical protein